MILYNDEICRQNGARRFGGRNGPGGTPDHTGTATFSKKVSETNISVNMCILVGQCRFIHIAMSMHSVRLHLNK